jgi:hypothetical protein
VDPSLNLPSTASPTTNSTRKISNRFLIADIRHPVRKKFKKLVLDQFHESRATKAGPQGGPVPGAKHWP